MATTAEKSDQLTLVFKAVLLGMAGFAAYKIGQEFGLFDTKDDTDVDKAVDDAAGNISKGNNPMLAFNPNYSAVIVSAYNKQKKPKIFNGAWNLNGLTQQNFVDMANDLYDARSIFNDDEDSVYSIFRKIQTQWQLSLLSLIFTTIHKKDLLQYLAKPSGFMNSEEMNVVIKMVKNYPQYRKA